MSNNKERGEQSLEQLDKALKARDRKEKTGPLKTVVAAAAAIVVVVGGIWFAATQNGDEEEITAEETSTQQTTEAPEIEPLAMTRETPLAETVACTYEETGDAAREVSVPAGEDIPTTGTVTVNLSTNQGNIGMELDRSVSPCTVNAIEHLAENDYYDDTVCHRLTTSGIFVLQCGDPSGNGAGGPGFQFANEYPTDEADEETSAVIYPRGSIAMANAGPGTNGSQIFLNYQDSPLAPDYTYFGQISEEGLATLDAIAEKGVEGGAGDGAPVEEIRIEEASIA